MLYERAEHLQLRKAGEEMLVHDLANEKIHVLNQTAGDLLEHCSRRTPEELASFLRARYEVNGQDIDRDVREILERFVENGLVNEVPIS
ncbi:PqqD family protein [bacterium]|nr:MAG: PqqD family protein [bacterium]